MSTLEHDLTFMEMALEEAERAKALGEIPVGAVIVRNGEVIAREKNLRETERMATAHAELLAVEDACRTLGTRRLSDCTLYVTLEPCPMCAGALVSARIGRIVFGAKDPRAGACGRLLDLFAYPLEARPTILGGVLEERCLMILRSFFEDKRKKS